MQRFGGEAVVPGDGEAGVVLLERVAADLDVAEARLDAGRSVGSADADAA